MAKNEIFYQGLDKISVLIDDRSYNSPDYFVITDIPKQLTAGKNVFKFKCNSNTIPNETDILCEVLDSEGLPVYTEFAIDSESLEPTATVTIFVQKDFTASGNGKIILCSRIPFSKDGDYLDTSDINLRWSIPIYFSTSKRNTAEIIFQTVPIVNVISNYDRVSEIDYLNLSASSGRIKEQTQTITITGQSAGIPAAKYYFINNTPVIILDKISYYTGQNVQRGFITSSVNSKISISSSYIRNAVPNSSSAVISNQIISSSILSFTGSQVFTAISSPVTAIAATGSHIIFLDNPISYDINNNNVRYYPTSADLTNLDVTYVLSNIADNLYTFENTTQNTYNSATIQFDNLITLTGTIAKIRSYYKSSGIGAYSLINETDITSYDYEFGFNTASLSLTIPLPTVHKNEKIDFKFEFLSPEGYISTQVVEVKDTTFVGGNTYIGGNDNLITGSLFVASSTGSGVEISGKNNSAMIRSIGYEGFAKAKAATSPGGFVIYSGSIQPILNASEQYSGVGIELFANTSSYFKYTTSGSGLLDIRTDSFFLGSVNQFVSGANGNIEISSSNFHLKPDGSVNMTGNITANTGIFKDVNIIGNIPSASISSGNKYIIENWVRTPADINTGFYKFATGSDASNTINQGLLNWTSSNIPNGAVTASALSGSLELPPGFLNWGSIINNFKGAEYNGYVGTAFNTLDFLDFKVATNYTTSSITSELIDFTSLFNNAASNNTPVPTLMLQFSTQFNALTVSSYSSYATASFTGQDPTTLVEIIDSNNNILYSDSRIQPDSNYLRDWNNFNIPLLSVLSDNNYVQRKKFKIRISWNKFYDPIGTGTVRNFRITELRIIDLPTSLGFATNAIQLQDSSITSNLGGSNHSGHWAPAEDVKFDLGTFNVRGDDVGIQLITPKRWRTIYSRNINTDQFTIADSTTTATTGKFSMATGNKSTAVNKYSHTEGKYTTTIGLYSHAEGQSTIAQGQSSHAEGIETTTGKVLPTVSLSPTEISASCGKYIFSGDITPYITSIQPTYMISGSYIGNNINSIYVTVQKVSTNSISSSLFITNYTGSFNSLLSNTSSYNGLYAHAEGRLTQAYGFASHAEGKGGNSKGKYSHAEGEYSYAIGDYSHAEGNNTIANGTYQHVQGQYNISSSAQSAFIVGNGTSFATRSNLIFASGVAPNGVVEITGSLNVSGSSTIDNILTLKPRTTTPVRATTETGSIIMSGSGGSDINLYVFTGAGTFAGWSKLTIT